MNRTYISYFEDSDFTVKLYSLDTLSTFRGVYLLRNRDKRESNPNNVSFAGPGHNHSADLSLIDCIMASGCLKGSLQGSTIYFIILPFKINLSKE